MSEKEDIIITIANDNVADDLILPFSLETSALRGRVARLGHVLDDILVPHNLDDRVAQILAEALTGAVLFAAMIKYEGIFTLQIQGDGAVPLLVVDINSAGELRGYARADKALPKKKKPKITDLVGKGYIAFTVDQGQGEDRYQGIVPLEGDSFENMCQNYFEQSEQIKTSFRIGARKIDGKWRAGGVMLQKMPDEGGLAVVDADTNDEDWERAHILLQSVKDTELTNADMSSEDVLFRLFHEEGVRIYSTQNVTKGCRCSNEKLEQVLSTLSEEDREECVKDGAITMTCEFCAKDWVFKT